MKRIYRKKYVFRTRRLFACAAVVAAALCACRADWQRDVEKNGIVYEKLRFNESLNSYTGYVAEDTAVNGFGCRKGWVRTYADGALKSCVLSEPRMLSGHAVPAGAWVKLDRDGNLAVCAFPGDVTINGIPCIGTMGDVKGFHTAFHPDGALRSCCPRTDVVVDGVPCRGGLFHPVRWHADHGLKECTAAEDITIDGVVFKKGETVRLEGGRPLKGR